MPSDPRIAAALAAVEAARSDFMGSVTTTAEEVRHFLESARSDSGGAEEHVTTELGDFGARYIDANRWAALITAAPAVPVATLETVQKALATLRELERAGDTLFVADVPESGNLRDTVSAGLASAGRAFGAARVVQSVRSGRYRLGDHARSLGAFSFGRWSRAERDHAPPLVVAVAGEDLRAGALDEFLDGAQKIILVATGATSPVPLVRLIGPGVFVQQAGAVEELAAMTTFPGPAIAAVVGDGAARFSHDPRRAEAGEATLVIDAAPDEGPRPVVGGLSAAQQNQEIRWLRALASSAAPAGPVAEAAPAAEPAPADRLAAWLLGQVDLEDAGAGR